jgi:hypothetical protein
MTASGRGSSAARISWRYEQPKLQAYGDEEELHLVVFLVFGDFAFAAS